MAADKDRARRGVRAAVEGADRAFTVIEGGGHDGGPASEGDDRNCPVTALGHLNGMLHFLDTVGQKRELSARALGSRHDLVLLFGGSEDWLRKRFPKKITVKRRNEKGEEVAEEITVDFIINKAAASLQARCVGAGIFGDHIRLRRPGIWTDAAGGPAVHCGDQVLIGGTWRDAGTRTGNTIWAAAPATPRPTLPCDSSVAVKLQDGLRDLWDWRAPGAEIVVIGWIANAYLGAAPHWRPNMFVTGSSGSGKSALLATVRAALPLHHFTTDTSKAGLEAAINGRAMPSVIDETSDRADQRGGDNGQALLDMVLSATGGEGTKGHRAQADGSARSFEVISPVAMFAINPPDMQPQHRARFACLDLKKPEAGADNSDAHARLAELARASGPALWGRALGAWDRYCASLSTFRHALAKSGCAPREQDQIGALLAGWWILTHEGAADDDGAREGIAALVEHTPRAGDVAAVDGPRQMLDFLLTKLVQMDRSTDRSPIASLLSQAWDDDDPTDPNPYASRSATAQRILNNYGIRAVSARMLHDNAGRPVPRMADGDGAWFANTNSELAKLFDGSRWAGQRWRLELLRLESARAGPSPVRIGKVTSRAVWIGRREVDDG